MRWDLSRMLIFIRHNFHLCILPLSCCALQFTEVKMITIILYSFLDTEANLRVQIWIQLFLWISQHRILIQILVTLSETQQTWIPIINLKPTLWDIAKRFEIHILLFLKHRVAKNLNPNPTLSETHSGKESQCKSYSFWNTVAKNANPNPILSETHSGRELWSASYSVQDTANLNPRVIRGELVWQMVVILQQCNLEASFISH